MVESAAIQADTSWFIHDRFGIFIHWGIYAQAARHEWVKSRERIDDAKYQKYFDHFNPDLYDPRHWAKTAREAGMKYFVITTKHHDGFCLWDTKFTDYKVTNTPYGKDLLRPMIEAFRAEGLKVGLYHSLIDWHHPEFPIDANHPLRDHPEALEWNKNRNVEKYAEYLHNQTRELLTEFGKIDIIWFDYSYPHAEYRSMKGKGCADWQSENLITLVRELQPGIIVNNRLDLPAEYPADVTTPEQYQPAEWVTRNEQRVVWEACQTFSGSWGYHRDETSWKSPEQLVRMLVNTVSCGGNLLMNVGPTARGVFDSRATQALEVYRDWIKWHARSIYGCTQSEYSAPPDVRYTYNPKTNRLYVHIFAWPFKHLHLPGLAGKVAYAQLLNDASEICFYEQQKRAEHNSMAVDTPDAALTLELPVAQPTGVIVPVAELFLK